MPLEPTTGKTTTKTKTKVNPKIVTGVVVAAVAIGASFVAASLLPAAVGTGGGCEMLYSEHEVPTPGSEDPRHKGSISLGENSKGNATVYVDKCYSAGTSQVTEHDCQPDGTYLKIVSCPNDTKCEFGACLPEPTPGNPADCSDGSRDCLDVNDSTKTPGAIYEDVASTNAFIHMKKGYCEYIGTSDGWDVTRRTSIKFKHIVDLGDYQTLTDFCSSGKVYEYDCDNSGFVRSRLATCPDNYICEDGACVIDVTETITIISPNGGESWTKGNVYDIAWDSSGVDEVSIDYRSEDEISGWGAVILNIPASQSSYSWEIPDFLAAGNYEIRVRDADDLSISDVSDDYITVEE